MVQPIEQSDVAIDLIKPAPVTMTNLLNLTHTTPFQPAGRKTTPSSVSPVVTKRQCDKQLACQRDDHRFARGGTVIGSAGLVPPRQCAVLLKQQESPGALGHAAADPGITLMTVYPGTATSGVKSGANCNGPLAGIWRIEVRVSGSNPNLTLSVGVGLVL